MYLPPKSGNDFTPPPAGTHLAVCYRVVDLGTQLVEWQGQQKQQHKIMLSWELPNELMEDGAPFTIHQTYTFSSSEKSTFRKHLESWRGKPFEDADFGPGGFDVKNVIGVGCFLSVLHNVKNGSTYANITAVAKLPKGTTCPPLVNEKLYFSLDSFDQAIFDKLSQGLRDKISKSPEYGKLMSQQPAEGGHTVEELEDAPF
jgi:hypothetical protein